jgi:hypothetical protein
MAPLRSMRLKSFSLDGRILFPTLLDGHPWPGHHPHGWVSSSLTGSVPPFFARLPLIMAVENEVPCQLANPFGPIGGSFTP